MSADCRRHSESGRREHQLPPGPDLPTRRPLLDLPNLRARHLHRTRPHPHRILPVVDPPPHHLTAHSQPSTESLWSAPECQRGTSHKNGARQRPYRCVRVTHMLWNGLGSSRNRPLRVSPVARARALAARVLDYCCGSILRSGIVDGWSQLSTGPEALTVLSACSRPIAFRDDNFGGDSEAHQHFHMPDAPLRSGYEVLQLDGSAPTDQ
jgi:hypothetical protein